jgi:hypothetical protein
MRRVTLILICVMAAGCRGPTSPEPPLVTYQAIIEGTVSSTSGPVAGAIVEFGSGGYFSLPKVHTSTTTDSAGHYLLSAAFRCGWTFGNNHWVVASAAGYQTTSIEHSGHQVECSNRPQRINISLARLP